MSYTLIEFLRENSKIKLKFLVGLPNFCNYNEMYFIYDRNYQKKLKFIVAMRDI